MHIEAASYDDFKRLIGIEVAKPSAAGSAKGLVFPEAKPGDTPEQTEAARDAAQEKWDREHPPAKAGHALNGTIYHWGGDVDTGDWGCAFVSDEQHFVVRAHGIGNPALTSALAPGSMVLLSRVEPPTFADDFPDAVALDGAPSVSF